MSIALPVAYGILAGVSLLILLGFVIMILRLERDAGISKGPRPPMPVAWPISMQGPPSEPSANKEPPDSVDARRRP